MKRSQYESKVIALARSAIEADESLSDRQKRRMSRALNRPRPQRMILDACAEQLAVRYIAPPSFDEENPDVAVEDSPDPFDWGSIWQLLLEQILPLLLRQLFGWFG